jgi:hypothetical protein
MIRRVVTCGALVCSVLVLAGCGGDRLRTAKVNGKVTYKGKPVPNGTVTFIPEGGGPSATGEIQSDGTFTMTTYSSGDGAILGKHKVVIAAMADMGDRLPEERSPLPPPIVPDKYTSPATSDLTTEVKDEENKPVFDLVGDKPAKRR